MSNSRVYNFAAGPSVLPLSVLERAGAEITNYRGSGMSVMEMSHRSKVFMDIFQETQDKLRRLMNVPENYRILFLQTGASGQFSAIPPSPATSPTWPIRRPPSTEQSAWPATPATATTAISPGRES